MARAVGLRGDDQIVVEIAGAAARDHRVQHELLIGAVEHQHRGLLVERVAGLVAGAHLPPVPQQRPQGVDLGLELVGGGTIEGTVAPVERRLLRLRVGAKARRFRVVHVGHDHHHLRMLGEAVRQLLERQAQILEAYLLADDQERHVGERLVQTPERARQDSAVTGARIEKIQRRRARRNVRYLTTHLLRDRPFLATGGDEHQVLLAVVEETERPLRGIEFVTHR